MNDKVPKFDYVKAKALIGAQGRTRAWVAEQCGIERQSLSLILNGHRNPGRQTWKLLAIALGTSEADLTKNTVKARAS